MHNRPRYQSLKWCLFNPVRKANVATPPEKVSSFLDIHCWRNTFSELSLSPQTHYVVMTSDMTQHNSSAMNSVCNI